MKSVRNDLINTFHTLFANPQLSLLDWVVIETTGLADPAPLIQSLYMDPYCKQHLRMDRHDITVTYLTLIKYDHA